MNFKTLVKLSLSMLFLVAMLSGVSFAQLSTVYVDVTNGSDTYSGANAINNPAGSGPKATLDAGLKAVTNGGKIVFLAGTYNGVNGAGGNIDINKVAYPNLPDNSTLTIELRQLNSNNEVLINAATFTYNIVGGTLNITSTNGTEYISLASGSVTLTAGSVNIANSNNFQLPTTATINIAGAAAFTGAAPKKGTNVTLSYTGGSSISAGPEANYGDYGTGSITVNKTAGTAITFPYAITKVAAITVTTGNASFNNAVTTTGDVTLTSGTNAFGALNLGTTATENAHLIVNGGTATFGAVTFSSTTNTLNDAITVAAGATATFGGNVDVKAGDIVVAGAATFNGNVALGYRNAAAVEGDIAQVWNSGTGTVAFNGTTTWSGLAKLTGAMDYTAIPAAIAEVTSTGTLTFNNISLTNPNTNSSTDGNSGAVVNVVNSSTGTLTLGNVTADLASSAAGMTATYVALHASSTSTGKLNLSGNVRGNVANAGGVLTIAAVSTIGGNLTNGTGTANVTAATDVKGNVTNGGTMNYAGGTVTGNLTNNDAMTFTGNVTVGGVLTNLATKTIAMGVNSLTLTNNGAAHGTTGGAITASTGAVYVNNTCSFNGGSFPAVFVAATKVATFSGAATVAAITLNGDVVANANVTVAGATSVTTGNLTVANAVTYKTAMFTQSGGTATLNGSAILEVTGDFNRTAGAFTANGTSTLLMKGTAAQNLNGGPLLQVVNLTFTNTTGSITLGQSVRASGNVLISASTALTLNTLNIILNANGATITNNGSYTAVGGGGVIFGGANTVQGGAAVTGTTIGGSGAYSYITVDVGAGNSVATASTPVSFNGVLTLKSGDLLVTVGHNFAPTGASASIIRDVTPVTGSLNGIIAGGGNGTFNSGTLPNVAGDYDLKYIGTLAGAKTITAGTSELDFTHVKNLTISTTGTVLQLASIGGTAVVVKGNLTLDESAEFTLDAVTPFDFEVKGVFSAAKKSILSGNTAAKAFKLSTNDLTHSIIGTVSALSPLTVSGTGVTINGTATSSAAASGFNAVINDLVVANNGSLTVANIQQITGAVTTGSNSTLSLGLATPDAGDGIVTKLITLGGATATLTTDVTALAGVAHNKGALDLNGKKLTLTTAGSYVRANDATATYPSTTGTLVLNFATLNFDMKGGSIPNVEVKNDISLGGDAIISNLFTHTAGAITLGNKLTVSGNMVYTAGTYTGATPVHFTGSASTITAAGSFTIPNVTLNSAGSVTLASNNSTARTLTVTGTFDHTAGTLALGINDLKFTDNGAGTDAKYTRTAGSVTATTSGADLGEFVFSGANGNHTITPNTGFVLPNIYVTSATSVSGTNAMTVSNNFYFEANFTFSADSRLAISDGATITRKAGVFDKVPAFGGNATNVIYTGAVTTGSELHTTVNNLTVNANVTLNAPVTVNGTMTLAGTFTTVAAKNVTLGTGATVKMNLAGVLSYPLAPTGAYNLIYNSAMTTTSNEWPAAANLSSLQILANTTLHADRTVAGTLTLSGADFEIGGKTLTSQGDITVGAGKFFTAATAANLVIGGNANTNLTLTEVKEPVANLKIKLAKTTGTNTVTLVGGSLDFHKNSSTLYFGNGLIVTGDNYVKLFAPLFMNGQGFDRSAVTGGNTSHIVGNVKKQLVNNGTIVGSTEYRTEFPTGSATMYRPAAITFNPVNGMSNVPNTIVTVSHADAAPTGTVGLPIADGIAAGVNVSRYPNFFWNLKSEPSSITPSVVFDLELGAAGFTNFDNVANIRTIRRNGTVSDITNTWLLQGGTSQLSYDNNVINSVPTIVVKNAQAGIIAGGSVYTLGLKSNMIVAAPIADKEVTVGSGVTKVVMTSPAVFGGNTGALTFTAQSSNVSVATVLVDGDSVKVTPVAPGSADISVTAKDINNDFLTTKFKFTVKQVTAFAVSGKVTYDNTSATALKGVVVTLTSSTKTYTATTANDGTYSIASVDNGTYTVTASSAAVWGGVNATDALLVANYYNGSQTLTPLRVAAADVNNSSTVNNTDALQILRRYNNLVTSFAKGDWTFAAAAVTVNGAAVTNANVTGIAVGDVNGSYAPAAAMSKATLNSAGSINVNPGAQISVPVNADVQNLGAASMTFRYAKDLATFAGVSSKLEGVVYNENDGVITVAWANLGKEVVNVNDETGFITLNFKPTEAMKAGKSFGLELDGAELATADAKVINNALLKTSEVKVVVPSEFALSQNYPNPFNPSTTINYDLPVNARVSLVVFDVLGREVAQLVNGMQDAGSYKIQFNASNLTSGIYFYTLNVSGDQKFVKTYKMMLMK